MKIIVSSTAFAKTIKKAIFDKTEIFTIYRDKVYPCGSIAFHVGLSSIGTNNIAIFEGDTYTGKFNMTVWNKLFEVLEIIPDQPITIEFSSYKDGDLQTNPEISIPHCTMKFYK